MKLLFSILCYFSLADYYSNTGATTTSATSGASSATPTAATSPTISPATATTTTTAAAAAATTTNCDCPTSEWNKCFWQEDIHMFIVWLQHNPTRRVVTALRFCSPQDQESPM